MSLEQKGSVKLADVLAANEENRFFLPVVEDIQVNQITGRGRTRLLWKAVEMVIGGVSAGALSFGTAGLFLASLGIDGTEFLILSGLSAAAGVGAAVYGISKE